VIMEVEIRIAVNFLRKVLKIHNHMEFFLLILMSSNHPVKYSM
jgi:hypothetical protein